MRAPTYICDLQPYQPGLPIELVAREYGLDPKKVVKLASNENPLGISQKARTALEQALPGVNRYPEQYELAQALAKHYHISSDMIVLGNGSNDVLDLIARVFLGVGDEAISSQYGFAVYAITTQSVGAQNVIVPAKGYSHDLAAMLKSITPKTKVIWLANPNNPTGSFVPYGEVKDFLAKVPEDVIVVLDEAYYEYLAPEEQIDTIAWLAEHPNLILVRTFSKIYGLAGLRVGYGIMSAEVTGLLNRVRQPFNVNTLAMTAATAALSDQDFVTKSTKLNSTGREQLLSGLKKLGLECLPAHGNFMTFRVGNAGPVYVSLLKQGVIIRPLAGYGMQDWLRATIGLAEENDRFLQALAEVL